MNKLLPLPFDHSFETAFKIIKNTGHNPHFILRFVECILQSKL